MSFTCSDSQLGVCLGDNSPQPQKQPKCEVPQTPICEIQLPGPLCVNFTLSDFGETAGNVGNWWRGYKFKFRAGGDTLLTALTGGSNSGDLSIFRLGGTNNAIIEEVLESFPGVNNPPGEPLVLSEPIMLTSDQYYFLAVGGGSYPRVSNIDLERMKEATGICEWEPSGGTTSYVIPGSSDDIAEDLVGRDITEHTNINLPDLGFQGNLEACE